ncbi:MAG: hypothetical protein KGQ60_19520, partial [Planctomycetes bacterium]|nr:hypothetical protein [Planctomycetota bacterium]
TGPAASALRLTVWFSMIACPGFLMRQGYQLVGKVSGVALAAGTTLRDPQLALCGSLCGFL